MLITLSEKDWMNTIRASTFIDIKIHQILFDYNVINVNRANYTIIIYLIAVQFS